MDKSNPKDIPLPVNSQRYTVGESNELISIFEQSWQYIRHSQNMFWQSFTALSAVITGILFYILDKGFQTQIIGVIACTMLALVGSLVCIRIIIILTEHFIIINRIRKQLGIDDIKMFEDKIHLIHIRWQKYDIANLKWTRYETLYILISGKLFSIVFSILLGCCAFLVLKNYFTSLPFSIPVFAVLIVVVSLIVLEMFGWKYAYGCEKKHFKALIWRMIQ